MAKPTKNLPKDPLLKQAVLETKVAYRPQKTAIRRATTLGTQDYQNAMARVKQVGSALLGQLGQIPGAYNAQSAPILGNLTQSIGGLGSMLNSSTIGQAPQSEITAGANNVGAIGAGAAEQISGQQQMMNDYLASGANQAAVQGAVTARNYTHDYANFLKSQHQQTVDVTKGEHDAILTRLDQLKQEAQDREIAMKQLGMQQEQIDQANRSLKAEAKFLKLKDALLLKKSRRGGPVDPALHPDSYPSGRNPNSDAGYTPSTDPTYTNTTGFGGGPQGPGPHIGDNTGAFGSIPSTTISGALPYAPAPQVLSFVQGLNAASDLAGARDAILAWAQNHGGQATTASDGTIYLIPGVAQDPNVQQIVQTFNQKYLMSTGGSNA